MTKKLRYDHLPTEQNNSASRSIDRVSIKKALQMINREDARVARVVGQKISAIEGGVQLIVSSLHRGGRLFFIGAGTSGRLGVMEAAECPPTFNTPRSLVQAFMAGGRLSVFRSKEGAEDNGDEAKRIVRKYLKTGDVLVGIAASGVTPYVREALKEAHKKKIKTILVTCHTGVPRKEADVVIRVNTGPEVIAGSTRLKAATATKMVLNSLTVASMVQLGKVYGNRMVDLQPRSRKLVARATHLISKIGQVSSARAMKLLKESGGNAKTAIVMARKNIRRSEAVQLLKKAQGHLHKIIPHE